MGNTEYTWIKGFIFQRKSDLSPFAIKTMQGKNENFTEFTVKFCQKNDKTGGEYDTQYFNCVAFGAIGEKIPGCFTEHDRVICKTVKKQREYNGKIYTNYTVYEIYRKIEAEQSSFTQAKKNPQETAQDELDFDLDSIQSTGKEVDIPF